MKYPQRALPLVAGSKPIERIHCVATLLQGISRTAVSCRLHWHGLAGAFCGCMAPLAVGGLALAHGRRPPAAKTGQGPRRKAPHPAAQDIIKTVRRPGTPVWECRCLGGAPIVAPTDPTPVPCRHV